MVDLLLRNVKMPRNAISHHLVDQQPCRADLEFTLAPRFIVQHVVVHLAQLGERT